MLAQWAPATLAYEAPLVTHMNSLPYGALARLARSEGVKSVLTGEGADELFFGYAETAFEPVRRRPARPRWPPCTASTAWSPAWPSGSCPS